MILNKLLYKIRKRIGNPDENQVSNRCLLSDAEDALEWLAGELKFQIKTEENAVAISASSNRYPLPSNVLTILWVEWNGNRLEPTSISGHDRDQTNWRTQTAGNPTSYAMQGRELILLPPPSSAAVTSDGLLSIRYVASADPMGADGPQGLSELDAQLVVVRAAEQWCRANPSDVNTVRAANYERELMTELLPAAVKRWHNPLEFEFSGFDVFTTRRGAAR